jgi:hypothetical protein
MGLFPLNFRIGNDDHLRRLAERIAEETLDEVIRRTTGLTTDMSLAEARGYVRARAARVVNRAVMDVCLRNRRLRRIDASELASLITDLLVDAVIREKRSPRRILAA